MAGQQSNFGPSWWDVERQLADFKRTWSRKVRIVLCPEVNPHSGQVSWSLLVTTFVVKDGKETQFEGQSFPFRGKGGASTVPAAITLCLSGLWERLEDAQEKRGSQLPLFPPEHS